MKLNNKGKGVAFATLSILAYAIPLIILAIIKHDKLFKTTETALTSLSTIMLLFFVVYAKKVVKTFCKVLTPLGFGSLVILLVSLGLQSFLDDLTLISIASLVGSIVAWYPYQIATIYTENAVDKDGNIKPTMSLREVNSRLLSLNLTVKE